MNRTGRRKAKGIYHKEDTTNAKEGQSALFDFAVIRVLRGETQLLGSGRNKHGDELSRLLKTLFLQKTAREWHELLEPQDVPVELPLTPAQASRTEYARAREAVAEVDGERHVLFPLWANGRRAGGLRRGTPALNADGRAVLQELGFAHDDIERILRSAASGASLRSAHS